MQDSTYEAYAIRFGSTRVRKSEKYHRFDSYGVEDEETDLVFYFWVIRNEERTILVDCGFDADRGLARGYHQDVSPVELLARIGVTPESVDHVVLSHMHFDHVGNIGLFPNATFTVARAEVDFLTGALADRPLLAHSNETAETELLLGYLREGRVRLVDGEQEIFPGVRVLPVRGHTPGQLLTTVRTASGDVVLASDAIHFFEEMELDRPYWVFHDLEGMYDGFAILREMARQPDVSIVAGHDPAVMTRFAKVSEHCVDLAVRR